eukprot:988018-Rhodomonas_salina.1
MAACRPASATSQSCAPSLSCVEGEGRKARECQDQGHAIATDLVWGMPRASQLRRPRIGSGAPRALSVGSLRPACEVAYPIMKAAGETGRRSSSQATGGRGIAAKFASLTVCSPQGSRTNPLCNSAKIRRVCVLHCMLQECHVFHKTGPPYCQSHAGMMSGKIKNP